MKVTDFSKRYKKYEVTLPNFNTEKRIIVLHGENGSGKSTLLKAIASMISYSGEITCTGTKSYMSEVLKFPIDNTVFEVINALNRMDKTSKERITHLIDQFDLIEKINNKISTLSKGMKMKLKLLCTFLIDRDIYILDEPFSGLDHTSVMKLVRYIEQSNKKFIIASHIVVDWNHDCEVIRV